MFKRIIIGIIGTAIGLLLIKFREKIQRMTGDIGFAEKIFGTGGTFTLILLIGALCVFLAIMYMFGILQGFLPNFLEPYF